MTVLFVPESGRDCLTCVIIGLRDYDYFISQSQQIYTRQVRLLAVNVLFVPEYGRDCLIYARIWP